MVNQESFENYTKFGRGVINILITKLMKMSICFLRQIFLIGNYLFPHLGQLEHS